MWYALIPYCYFIKTRLSRPAQQISWFFVYFVPVFLFYIILDYHSFFALILSYYVVNLVYENGYIQNDVITTRIELNPTKRLSDKDCYILYSNIEKIFLSRFFIFVFFILWLYALLPSDGFVFLLLLLFLLQILFIFYNLIRGKFNFYLILPLSYLRFYLPILPFLILNNYYVEAIALFFVYPLAKLLEFSKEEKFGFKRLPRVIGNIDKFRVVYYLIVGSLLLFSYLYFSPEPVASLIVTTYYFLYRLLGYFIYYRSARFKKLVISGAKKEFRE